MRISEPEKEAILRSIRRFFSEVNRFFYSVPVPMI